MDHLSPKSRFWEGYYIWCVEGNHQHVFIACKKEGVNREFFCEKNEAGHISHCTQHVLLRGLCKSRGGALRPFCPEKKDEHRSLGTKQPLSCGLPLFGGREQPPTRLD